MDNEKSIKEKIRPIMEGMVYDLACDKPENIVSYFLTQPLYMINWLQKYGGYTSNGIKQ
jgi:hypothetical protein